MLEPAKYKCKDSNSTSNSSDLQKRKKSRQKRVFACTNDDCDKSYTCSSHLMRHEEIHIGNFQCTEENCRKNFKSKSTLKKHVDNVHLKKNPKKYKCPQCEEEFNKHNWLTSHQFKHTGVKPYVCPEGGCEKAFLVPSKLKRHMKIHEGYTCTKENCGKIFPKWTLYTKHLKISHPTIHKCHYCEREFSRSNNLKAHMEIHNLDREVFSCPKPDCSRFYFMKRNLNHHIKSYHEKRPFICTQEHCHKAFKSEADMIAHCSRHDPSKRTRRKKKKSHRKPSFAARLAGLAPKKWQLQPVIEYKTEDKEETSDDYTSGSEKSQNESGLTSAEKILPEQINQDVLSLTGVEHGTSERNYSMDNGIQMLLNMIEERNRFGSENTVKKTKYISLKA